MATKLTRDEFIPYLDIAEDRTFASPTWARIDLSTTFELAINPVSEDIDYISKKNTETEVTGNAPELPQEIAIYEDNPMYDYLIAKMQDLPTGEDCKVPFLLCFGGSDMVAWRCTATLLFDTLNTVDGKLTFTIKFGSDVVKGTYTLSAQGVPTFTP